MLFSLAGRPYGAGAFPFGPPAPEAPTLPVQFVSDVHVEFRGDPSGPDWPRVPVAAPVLVLAGDIGDPWDGRYERFLRECRAGREAVLVVAGNHEFYGRRTMAETTERLRATCARAGCVYLEGFRPYRHRGVAFVGDTLWSDADPSVGRLMNDYAQIPGFTVPECRRRHREAVGRLEWALGNLHDETVVVVTHHAPLRLLGGHASPELASAYGTDLRRLVRPPAVAWIFGHTHQPTRVVVGGGRDDVRVVSNPLGYPGELGGPEAAAAVIEV